ncbi:MAG: AAA family ATPase [Deltaproteobacteria bacterium]|nr:AAA family ATPase [Deltaproteobacteria bacterium]
MGVTRLVLEDFGAFERVDLRFCSGINVFLGANATGKTHAMKALYASLRAAPANGSTLPPKARLAEKFARVFQPADAKIGRLTRRRAGQRRALIRIEAGENELAFTIHSKDSSLRIRKRSLDDASALFLPSHELLSMYEGFAAAYRQRELSFDETYYDGCMALSASSLRGSRPPPMGSILTRLEKVVGGKTAQKGDRFYVGQLEAHLVAEGHRKLASLARLISNGEVAPGRVLIWDEPEANLNPKLVVELAEMLAELADAGVQVVCASHDYLFTQTLELLSEERETPVRYFSFVKQREGTRVSSADVLGELPENLIRSAFMAHFDRRRSLE